MITTYFETVSKLSRRLDWFPPLLSRLAVGWVFAQSGWGKLHNLEGVIGFFTSLGLPAPSLMAPFVASTELVCGVLLLVGLATRFASLPLIVTMVVAIATAKKADLESVGDLFGLSEFLFIAVLVWLLVYGAGRISLDALLARRWTKP